MERVRVLHICLAAFYIDNYGYQENILPKYHKALGHEVQILASTENYSDKAELTYVKPQTYINEHQIQVTRIPYSGFVPKRIQPKLRVYKGVKSFLRSYSPDIIFLHDVQSHANYSIVKFLKNNPKTTLFIDGHADFTNSARTTLSLLLHRTYYRLCAKIIEPYASKIFGTLPCRIDFFHQVYGLKREKLSLLQMGYDDDIIEDNSVADRVEFLNSINFEKDKFNIITGGKINLLKNIHFLIKAVNKMSHPDIRLYIFGDIKPEVEKLVQKELNDSRIVQLGWLNNKQIYTLLQAGSLSVFPGKHSVLWEQAVGLGVPSVFKRIEGHQHVDLNGNAIFLDEINESFLSKVISDLYIDREELAKMKKIAMSKGSKIFSYREIAKRSIQK